MAKIKVTYVSKGWKPDNAEANFKPIYTIHIEGEAEPQKTQDPVLAELGTYEAETYPTKSGKTYWRSVETATIMAEARDTQFKADPVKQESIEWQSALKAAVEAVHDYYDLVRWTEDGVVFPTLENYKKEIVNAVVTFTQTIERKPDQLVPLPERTQRDPIDDQTFGNEPMDGDTVGFFDDDDEPPIESRVFEEDLDDDKVDLSDIPF